MFLRAVACLAVFAYGSQGRGADVPKEDRAWKRYANKEWGYCISYPRRWHRGQAFDGAGLYAAVNRKNSSLPIGALDVAAFADGPAVTRVGFHSDVEAHLEGLRRFAHAQDTEILEQRAFPLSGTDGLFVKARYFDPVERSEWIEELVFARHNGVLYRLELQTQEQYLSRFEAVFARFAQSLALECRGR